jgi:Tol biopolymer transport system component
MALLLAACGGDAPTAVTPPPAAPTYDLAYESAYPDNPSMLRLVVRSFATGVEQPLFGQEIVGATPTVSGDGSRVVFVGPRPGDDYDWQDLWTVQRNGTPQRIELGVRGPEFAPALSPDGTRLAFVRLDDAMLSHLFVADVSGANELEITFPVPPSVIQSVSSPAWSADGKRLLFSAGQPGLLHLWSVRADGTGLVQYTDAAISDLDGVWSPDGRQIAFVRTTNPAQSQLMLLDVSTGQERSFGYAWRSRYPAWSPDGSQIAFVSNMADNEDLEVYTVRPDGSALTRLTDDGLRQQRPQWLRRP